VGLEYLPVGRTATRRPRHLSFLEGARMTPTGQAGTLSMRSSTRGHTSSYRRVTGMAESRRQAPLSEPYSAEAGTPSPAITASRGNASAESLRAALRDERFVLHYQPIACLKTDRVSHYEALVRMIDEHDGSIVAPGAFLPAAERHGLIGEIDRFVIRQVATLLGSGAYSAEAGLADRDAGELRVAVNLSALSACDPGTLDYVRGELERHGVDPTRMVFEITETAAITDIDQAKALCRGLQALGCDVALDDFGAGFGSFHYVKHLPFGYLKIDGEFIRELTSSHQDQLFVRALVAVAQGMNMKTIAEYVSDEPTMELLRELGVDYAQGFEVGRPAPLSEQLCATVS
jgi:EAL domain-containing protein (putative c-di-GMP-specific phosphodiesterase class I)